MRGYIFTLPAPNLLGKRLISAEQKLLARLAARIKRPRDLRAAERAVRQIARRTRARTERLAPRTGR